MTNLLLTLFSGAPVLLLSSTPFGNHSSHLQVPSITNGVVGHTTSYLKKPETSARESGCLDLHLFSPSKHSLRMSSRSSNFRSQSDRQPRSSIFSTNIPSPVRNVKRGTTDHSQSSASDLLDEYIPRRQYRESPSVPQPRPEPSTGSSSTHQSHSSYTRSRRRNPQPSFPVTERSNAIDDSRFEKMLALLDVDDSVSDSADRRRPVEIDGPGESRIPSVIHDSRVCTIHLRRDEVTLTR